MKKIIFLFSLTIIMGCQYPSSQRPDSRFKFIATAVAASEAAQREAREADTTPVINAPAPGHYNTPQDITITTSMTDATIYYTLDGSDPTTTSAKYTHPIGIWILTGAARTIKAIAVKSGVPNSPIATLTTGIYSMPPLKTGQTTQHRARDNGAIQSGVERSYTGPTAHSTFTSDYITRDNVTSLIWKSCPQGLTGVNCATGGLLSMNWNDANDGENGCKALNSANNGEGYAGIKNWRLPTREELATLVNFDSSITDTGAMINRTAFPGTREYTHWASQDYLPDTTKAQAVSFNHGESNGSVQVKATELNRVHCVSSALPKTYSSNFTDNGNGTIKDNATGLTWRKCVHGQSAADCSDAATVTNWDNAIDACTGDYRLPTINELQTIMNIGINGTIAIDTNYFPTGTNYRLWSSTTAPKLTGEALRTTFEIGLILRNTKGTTIVSGQNYFARCVTGP
jgi:hypothetical protein